MARRIEDRKAAQVSMDIGLLQAVARSGHLEKNIPPKPFNPANGP
jgi:hypothetical protein